MRLNPDKIFDYLAALAVLLLLLVDWPELLLGAFGL